jgi:putative restriction endonuclease
VQNGVSLRADIHTLFDLGLIQIDPTTFAISVADELKNTRYKMLDGKKLRLPKHKGLRPNIAALNERLKMIS